MEIDTRARLHDSIDLIVKGDTHTQCLDYKNVPFLCHRCHALGIFFYVIIISFELFLLVEGGELCKHFKY